MGLRTKRKSASGFTHRRACRASGRTADLLRKSPRVQLPHYSPRRKAKGHRLVFPSEKLEAVEWGSEPNVNPQADLLTAHRFADGHTAARCTRSASAIAPLLTPEKSKRTPFGFPSKKLGEVEWGSEPNVNPQADLLTDTLARQAVARQTCYASLRECNCPITHP